MTEVPNLFAQELRAPATPLVVHDPYFSIWSNTNSLTDSETVHWTGREHPLHAMIRIGEKCYRILGAKPVDVPAMTQKRVIISPTITSYLFECPEANVKLDFTTPLFPENLELMSRPATYVTIFVSLKNNRGESPAISFYFDAGAEIAVNTPDQVVQWSKMNVPKTNTIQLGTVEQNILGRKGDNVRIDWGTMILSVPSVTVAKTTYLFSNTYVGNGAQLRDQFRNSSTFSQETSLTAPCSVESENVTLASVTKVQSDRKFSSVQATFILAYDDLYSIRYFNKNLQAWWKRDGKSTETMLSQAWNDAQLEIFDDLKEFSEKKTRKVTPPSDDDIFIRCMKFNQRGNTTDIMRVGGKPLTALCSLAYRQVIGAQKIVADSNGMPLMFSKENFSNGCIGTVDILYPTSPFLLFYSPMLMKASLQPIFDYAKSPRWNFPFAPHDLGTYPQAMGQVYGGGEKDETNQMPVEESANMIILVAALSAAENNVEYAKLHWDILTQWAGYLLEKGFDPENQLCTDDFAGHLAHNTNLSLKAIIALACYAQLAEKLGYATIAQNYRQKAEEFAALWVSQADDGDHFRLAFDQPGTWSLKYNLVWDQILELNLFPASVARKELDFYQTKMEKYGIPLDNRSLYSKIDWLVWTASLTTQSEMKTYLDLAYAYVNETPSRVPICDWYWTDSGKKENMLARSVVGGFWIPLLKNRDTWRKRAEQCENILGSWALLPIDPDTPAESIGTALAAEHKLSLVPEEESAAPSDSAPESDVPHTDDSPSVSPTDDSQENKPEEDVPSASKDDPKVLIAE